MAALFKSNNVSRHPLMNMVEGGTEEAFQDGLSIAHHEEIEHLLLDARWDVPRKEGWPTSDRPPNRTDRVKPGGDAVLQGGGPGLIGPLRTVNQGPHVGRRSRTRISMRSVDERNEEPRRRLKVVVRRRGRTRQQHGLRGRRGRHRRRHGSGRRSQSQQSSSVAT